MTIDLLQVEIKHKTIYRVTLVWGGYGSAYTSDLNYEFIRLFETVKMPTIAKYFNVTYKEGWDDSSECNYEARFTSPDKEKLLSLKYWFDNMTDSVYDDLRELLKPINEAMDIAEKLDENDCIITYIDIDEEKRLR